MTHDKKRGGPGSRRGLPAPRPGAEDLRRVIDDALGGDRTPRLETALTGVLQRLEIEMRPLVLVADDGRRYELAFPPGWHVEVDAGARVTVLGRIDESTMSISQVGPLLRVRSLSRPEP